MFKKITILGIVVALSSTLVANANHFEIRTDSLEVIKEYADLIGICDCKSLSRTNTGQWGDTTNLIWKWEYIMNGKAIQDTGEYYYANKQQSFTSIRVYDSQNNHWYVSYFTPNLTSPPLTWTGGKEEDQIVLKREDDSQGGKTVSTLTFSNISKQGFSWEGTLTQLASGTNYTFWKIWCEKRKQ